MLQRLKDIILELKKVVWPTRRETFFLLIYTVILCGIIALIIVGLDVVFLEIRNYLLNL